MLIVVLFAFVASARAAQNPVYAWADANLALLYPAGWAEPVASADGSTLSLTLTGGGTQITLAVLPNPTDDAALRSALDAQMAAAGLLPLHYNLAPMYGRGGLRVEAVSADRQLSGVARSGHLPDDRVLLIVGRAPQAESAMLDDLLSLVLNSLVFSASVTPVAPTYAPVWTMQAANAAVGLALGDDRLYSVSAEDGVQVYDAKTGALLTAVPFDHPAQPTGLAVDAQGAVYVGDVVCRCVRIANPAGRWIDPVGSFGGGAPFGLALAGDGAIYAVDKKDSGYFLRVLAGALNRAVGLNFNGSAPPLLTVDQYGQVWVIEWLESLIDGSISGAVSLVGGAKPEAELQFWLEGLSPEKVTAMTTNPDGDLIVATTNRGILVVNSAGQVVDRIAQDAQALAFGGDGTLYLSRADGTLSALNMHAAPDRFGASALALGVPVGGALAENAQQEWTYQGAAGERVTLSAVDQTRTDASALGLDMALRLIAPDGSEVAYNDDQAGADLFGIYDAQIPDVTLPQAGAYTVRVEWRQGQGTYTLGISSDQSSAPGADGVIRIEGYLQDVFPSQNWTFAGKRGDVLTLTMTAESASLDAALALYKPDGRLLAYNDDAADPMLNTNAQLTQVRLPADGTYTVAASRANGSGRYNLTIVNIG